MNTAQEKSRWSDAGINICRRIPSSKCSLRTSEQLDYEPTHEVITARKNNVPLTLGEVFGQTGTSAKINRTQVLTGISQIISCPQKHIGHRSHIGAWTQANINKHLLGCKYYEDLLGLSTLMPTVGFKTKFICNTIIRCDRVFVKLALKCIIQTPMKQKCARLDKNRMYAIILPHENRSRNNVKEAIAYDRK